MFCEAGGRSDCVAELGVEKTVLCCAPARDIPALQPGRTGESYGISICIAVDPAEQEQLRESNEPQAGWPCVGFDHHIGFLGFVYSENP